MLRWRGLPIQLFVLTILPLTLLLLVIAFGSLFLHQRSMRQLVGERDERAARAAASAISEQLKHRAAATRSLALRAADLGSAEHVIADAVFLLPDYDGGIALYDGESILLETSNDSVTWELTVAQEQLALRARQRPAVVWQAGGEGVVLPSPGHGDPPVPVCQRQGDGQPCILEVQEDPIFEGELAQLLSVKGADVLEDQVIAALSRQPEYAFGTDFLYRPRSSDIPKSEKVSDPLRTWLERRGANVHDHSSFALRTRAGRRSSAPGVMVL